MMKLQYPIYCRLDIHKKVIGATIVTTNSDGISECNQKSFLTINSNNRRFHKWLIENGCFHVYMESTVKYWAPIFNYLEDNIDVCLTHPKYVKVIKGKIDKKDSGKNHFTLTDYEELMAPQAHVGRAVLNKDNVYLP